MRHEKLQKMGRTCAAGIEKRPVLPVLEYAARFCAACRTARTMLMRILGGWGKMRVSIYSDKKTSVDFVQFLNHAPSTLIFNLSDWI